MIGPPQVWVFTYPDLWPKPLMSLNDRGQHWAGKAAKTAQVRTWACAMALADSVPALSHCVVEMVWTVPDKRRRDAENPVPDLKAFCDGMVDAGVTPDDVPEWMTKLMPRIEYVKGVSVVRFEVSGVPADSCTTVGGG